MCSLLGQVNKVPLLYRWQVEVAAERRAAAAHAASVKILRLELGLADACTSRLEARDLNI